MSSKRRRKKARVPGLIITIILLLLVAEFVGLLAITKLLPVYLLFAVGIVFMTCVLLVAMLTGNFRKKVRFIIGAILGVLLLAILLLGNLYVMSTYNTLNMSLRHVTRHAGCRSIRRSMWPGIHLPRRSRSRRAYRWKPYRRCWDINISPRPKFTPKSPTTRSDKI